MSAARVLFKLDPSIVIAEHTEMGPGVDPRAPARAREPSWVRFPFAAAVDAGIPYVRDIAPANAPAHLVQIEDDALVNAIDRDMARRAAAERASDDTVVIDVEDL